MTRGGKVWSWRAGALILALACAPGAASAQQGPRPLFPDAPPPLTRAPPATVLPPLQPAPPPSIRAEPLPPPTLAALGLPTAQDELGGPLWPEGAPEHLPLLLDRLPADIAEPTLHSLQRALLTAPGPGLGAPREIFFRRVERLLAMGEPEAALELLNLIPEGGEGEEIEALRLRARFAADEIEPACAAAGSSLATGEPWPEARLVCAALRRDVPAVALALDLFRERGQSVSPTLAGLADAHAVGSERYRLTARTPDDPLLLPLLRRTALDIGAEVAAKLPPAVRRALAVNPDLASTVRAAAGGPQRPGPSVRPTLQGHAPVDGLADLMAVPAPRRPLYMALMDGLGLDVAEPVWAALAGTAPDGGPAPELFLWRGLDRAVAAEQRGEALLYALLLLDGGPEAADPLSLRAVLRTLRGFGLDGTARALATGVGGALGL